MTLFDCISVVCFVNYLIKNIKPDLLFLESMIHPIFSQNKLQFFKGWIIFPQYFAPPIFKPPSLLLVCIDLWLNTPHDEIKEKASHEICIIVIRTLLNCSVSKIQIPEWFYWVCSLAMSSFIEIEKGLFSGVFLWILWKRLQLSFVWIEYSILTSKKHLLCLICNWSHKCCWEEAISCSYILILKSKSSHKNRELQLI